MKDLRPTLPLLPLIDGALFVSGTFIELAMSCSRAAQYYKLDGRVSAAPASALTLGKHLHTALEFRIRQQEHGFTESEIDQRVAALMESEYAREPVAEGDWRNLNWCMTLYAEHCKRFAADQHTLLRYSEPRPCPQCKGVGQQQCLVDLDPDHVIIKLSPCVWCNGTGLYTLMVEVPFVFKLFDYEWLNA